MLELRCLFLIYARLNLLKLKGLCLLIVVHYVAGAEKLCWTTAYKQWHRGRSNHGEKNWYNQGQWQVGAAVIKVWWFCIAPVYLSSKFWYMYRGVTERKCECRVASAGCWCGSFLLVVGLRDVYKQQNSYTKLSRELTVERLSYNLFVGLVCLSSP